MKLQDITRAVQDQLTDLCAEGSVYYQWQEVAIHIYDIVQDWKATLRLSVHIW